MTKKGTSVESSYSYTYDSNGNILTVNEVVGNKTSNTTYSYDKLNRITSVVGTKNADSYYEYDYRGNRKANFEQTDFLSENSASYKYDMLENMYYSKTGEDISVMKYGTNGYRYVKKVNSELPKYYIYDRQGRLQTEVTFVNATVNGTAQIVMYPEYQYIWGPDKVLAQFDVLNNEIYYYLYNGHGDVVEIVDTDGNIVNSYDYDVWGNFITKDETIHNPFTYFGQTYDDRVGLYYLRARYYDPTTGRFTRQDPAEDGYNWYVYGNQNPVLWLDENGESAAVIGIVLYEAAPYIAAGAAAVGASIIYMAEHRKKGTTNPANKAKHERGQKRKQNDSFGGEKGDARRTPRKDKRKR